MAEERHLYIISGPNGAGKTTASMTVLPRILQCREFVNADEIARGLSPFNPGSVAIEAGRLMSHRIDELLAQGESFAIETTLAARSYNRLVERAHRQHYDVTLLYFWLHSPQLAAERVAERVNKGGHDIPHDTIERRYYSGICNFFQVYAPIVDYWTLVDNSEVPRTIVAKGGKGMETIILDKEKYEIISSLCRKEITEN